MKIGVCLLINLLLFLGFTYVQTSDSIITWEKSKKLSWSDFRAKPDSVGPLAKSSCGFGYKGITGAYDKYMIQVIATFNRDSSWTRYTDLPGVLVHEQGHFDMAEIYARKFRKVLQAQVYDMQNVWQKVDSLFFAYHDSLRMRNYLYDKETGHAVKNQIKWTQNIHLELKSLEKYSYPYVTIYLKAD
jgi:hypothetical protein